MIIAFLFNSDDGNFFDIKYGMVFKEIENVLDIEQSQKSKIGKTRKDLVRVG